METMWRGDCTLSNSRALSSHKILPANTSATAVSTLPEIRLLNNKQTVIDLSLRGFMRASCHVASQHSVLSFRPAGILKGAAHIRQHIMMIFLISCTTDTFLFKTEVRLY